MGGLIGYVANGNVVIENSYINTSVQSYASGFSARSRAGGFVGLRESVATLSFKNCYVRGGVQATGSYSGLGNIQRYAGDLVGDGGASSVSSCYVSVVLRTHSP